MSEKRTPEELAGTIDYNPPKTGWMDTPPSFAKGTFNYAGIQKSIEYIGQANPRKWQSHDEDPDR